ncbi:MAG: PAAR domain-containing protein [Planctomycetaceae bacterium]|nr:PAAR domain-containing protein [Planctomycetaceae bacterium]
MPPAARIGDMHVCPMIDPGPKPHVGGPIVKGEPTVLIGAMPAARVTDVVTCVGPPDAIAKGSMTVQIGFLSAARLGDPTMHGGVITVGFPTVLIGDIGMGGAGCTDGT